MSSQALPVSNFEINVTDHSRRKRGKASASSARGLPKLAPKRTAEEKARLAEEQLRARNPNMPTRERLAKDDGLDQTAGHYRAPEPVERLYRRGSLDPMPHINSAMYEAALKLRRHFEAAQLVGIKAQDLNRTISSGGGDSLEGEENWVHHFDVFRKACKVMGWHDAHPHRGAGRITVAVICYDCGVKDAAAMYRPGGGNESQLAKGMDVLREGLFALALLWKLC